MLVLNLLRRMQFQSTHPVRGGTAFICVDLFHILISIHPPREGWDYILAQQAMAQAISIHPPREGWDLRLWNVVPLVILFQSTHPVRGGTGHALPPLAAFADFNPPTP